MTSLTRTHVHTHTHSHTYTHTHTQTHTHTHTYTHTHTHTHTHTYIQESGIDLSILTKGLVPQIKVTEPDVMWDFDSLFSQLSFDMEPKPKVKPAEKKPELKHDTDEKK